MNSGSRITKSQMGTEEKLFNFLHVTVRSLGSKHMKMELLMSEMSLTYFGITEFAL